MAENNNRKKVHYIHRLSSVVQERIAGIFILIALLVIAGLILIQIQSSHLFDDRIYYDTYLTNAQGISTETLINISGIEVGRVMTIDITSDNRIHVKFFVYEGFQRLLRTDSTGELSKLSVIGNTAIIIKAGSHQLPILEANSTIAIEEPVTIDVLIGKLTPVITSLNEIVLNVSALIAAVEPAQLRSATEDLALLMKNLREISDQVAGGKGLVGKILYDDALEQEITLAIQGVNPIVKDVAKTVRQAKKDMQLVEKILLETEKRVQEIALVLEPAAGIADKSNRIASELQFTTQQVNREIGQLPEMVDKMQRLLDSTNRTINATQQIWPLSTVIAPASKATVIRDQPLDD